MKLIVFSLTFAVLVAMSALASGLEITEIDFSVDYDDAYTYRLENRERITSGSVAVANSSKIDADLFPGSNITFTIRVENTFQGENPKLRGVLVRVTVEDIDDGSDLDEESIDFDLEPGDDNRVDVKFSIPLDSDAGTYNTRIEVEGEDRNETSYNTEVNLKLEVKKQSHDIRITKVLIAPSIVDCNRKTKLTAEIMNLGSNLENQVALEFKSSSIGVNSFDRDIVLESSDDASDEEKIHTKSLSIEVPSFFKAGTYPISINLYWKNFVLFDQKNADLIVRDCIASGATKTEPKQEAKDETWPVTVIEPEEREEEQSTKENQQEELITATQEVSVLNSPLFLSMFLGGFIVIILVVLIVIGYFRMSKA